MGQKRAENCPRKKNDGIEKSGYLDADFSLPSPYGIGTMGREARAFIDFLSDTGQSCWQMLPIRQTSYGDSPYQSFSSFAGNPYFIDLDELARQGLLLPEEYLGLDWGDDPSRVDYALFMTIKEKNGAVCWFEWEEGECLQDPEAWMRFAGHMPIRSHSGRRCNISSSGNGIS